ncbi:hypothetical protein [Shewanella baltica]|uniref:hypothetical protein n=1 Tax=Shewanella baltica TaxID=62322 RepID=UPI003D79A17D
MQWLDGDILKKAVSQYPSNFIPAAAKEFVYDERDIDGGISTVKGFYIDGVFHIQEVVING